MSKKFLPCLLMLCLLLLKNNVTAQSQDTAKKKSGETYALVVGVAEYENKSIPRLQYSGRDATLFAEWLKSKSGGAVPDTHIKLLVDSNATIAAIYNAMDGLLRQAGEHDIVYFYFSGHGDVETKDSFNAGYLLAYNSPPNNYNNNAITIENLNSQANELTLKNKAKVILITDACHSGKLAGDFYKGKQLVAEQLRDVLNKEVRLAACDATQEADEGVFWGGGRGAFSYYLLLGLTGDAEQKKDGIITVKEMNEYLDSSFAKDKELQRTVRKQTPVVDGHPDFPLGIPDVVALRSLKQQSDKVEDNAARNDGTEELTALGREPIDYFFELMATAAVDSALHFSNYLRLNADSLPARILSDYIQYLASQQEKYEQYIKLQDRDEEEVDKILQTYANVSVDTLVLLLDQVRRVKSLTANFADNYIQSVHTKAQDMINAYLTGDLAELERRQYYFSGARNYDSFLVQMKLVINLLPESHYLVKVMHIQYYYLAGLCDRMKMATSKHTAPLIQSAFANQRKALQYDRYAAYIHNELGNLFFFQRQYDSAASCFKIAAKLSPTWAIPWSNLIRLNLGLHKIPEAKEAIRMADSLQPNLAYVLVNAGLVMEQDSNWLAAQSYYLRAIAGNKVHYLPFERLGKIYTRTGNYSEANYYLHEASMRKDKFKVNEHSFEFGIELGGPPRVEDMAIVDSFIFVLSKLYPVAARYENTNGADKALAIYATIADIENTMQLNQASFKGLKNMKEVKPGDEEFMSVITKPDILLQYEKPVPQGGIIKAARLNELMGDYLKAEALLLGQVANNRYAGSQRRKMLDLGFVGPGQIGGPEPPFNYYWLNINLALESETYNFYKRMQARYPRDAEWYGKAGLFLHDRLYLTFNRIPVQDQQAFYRYLVDHAYPFLGSVEDHEAYDIQFSLPGTAEKIEIHVPKYDPVTDAIYFLEQSSKLSGDTADAPDVLAALANLNGWKGNEGKSVQYYQSLVERQPGNEDARHKLFLRLDYNNLFPEALKQMKILDTRDRLNQQELYQLASYQMAERSYEQSLEALSKYKAANRGQQDSVFAFKARLNIMQGNPEKALYYVKDSMKAVPVNEWMGDDEYRRSMNQNYFRLYAIARCYALMHQNQKAMTSLKAALDGGLWYQSLLRYDEVWSGLRGSSKWTLLLGKYSFEEEETNYHLTNQKQDYNTVNYRIPAD